MKNPKTAKSVFKGWIVKDPDGKQVEGSLGEFKEDAIWYAETRLAIRSNVPRSWTALYHKGFRCVPVDITERKRKS